MVYRIALSHTLDKSSAEDIFQEVFLSLAENFTKLENGDHLKHWLIRTAINKSISYNRKFSRRNASTVRKSYSDDTALQDLKAVIDDLPEKYRIVIFLCCYEGYTTKETAKILNKSEGTVKSQLFRAKKLLKKELEE